MLSSKPKLLLIDSSALIYRSFYALPPLTDRQGRVVNAVYGFTSTFLNIIKQNQPTHVIFAFDSPKPTHRKKKYAEYKAQRAKAPNELYQQMPISKKMVASFNFLSYEKPGFEADDIIATCNELFLHNYPEGEIVIATGDLDTLQLVNPRTKVQTLSRGIGEVKIYDEEQVRERFGLEPNQMIDYKAIYGDNSDNIKGVKGIGAKTATDLLQKYGALDNIFQHLSEIRPHLQTILTKEKDQAYLSQELVTLHRDLPLKVDWSKAQFSENQLEKGKDNLLELGFSSLVNRLEKWDQKSVVNQKKSTANSSSTVNNQLNYIDIIEISTWSDLVSNLASDDQIFFWAGETWKGKGLIIASFSKNSDANQHRVKQIFFLSNQKTATLPSDFPSKWPVFVFDLKELMKNLPFINFPLQKVTDLKLQAYLIQPPLVRKFTLKEIFWHFLKEKWAEPKTQLTLLDFGNNGYDASKIKELISLIIRLIPEIKKTLKEQVAFQQESQFLSTIFPTVKTKIVRQNISHIYQDIELPLAKTLALMELSGIKVDTDLLEKLRLANEQELNKLKETIYSLSGQEFNLDSPAQLANILFKNLDIFAGGIKKGKSGHYSTSADILDKLKNKHPIITPLLEYREKRKLQSTYFNVIPRLVNSQSQRLFTSFDQTGTATGRLSSNNPNLQNIPLKPISRNSELTLRHTFIADKGFSLVSLDYSQIEIRLVAYLSGEQKLIEAFKKGEDIHRRTASLVHKINLDEVNDQLRNAAKAFNFGIIYGISAFGFAKSSHLPEYEARLFIENYLAELPKIAQYTEEVKAFARQNGFVETLFGRRRYVPEAASPNKMLRQAGERMAINMPVQGTAADIMKIALVKVGDYVALNYPSKTPGLPLESPVRLLLTIHDEIILEVRNDLVDKIKKNVCSLMEDIIPEILPLKVDVHIGQNWGEI